jgi:hypothetical protein
MTIAITPSFGAAQFTATSSIALPSEATALDFQLPRQISVASDPGHNRTHNEDCFYIDKANGIYAVADGMGGFNAGEVASRIAIETLSTRLVKLAQGLDRRGYEAGVRSAFSEANAAVLRTSARRPECLGMGTTLTLLLTTPYGWLTEKSAIAELGRFSPVTIRSMTCPAYCEERSARRSTAEKVS